MIIKGLPVLIACLTLCLTILGASNEGDFHKMKDRNRIDLYYRWMQMPDGDKVRQMKAVLEINGFFVIKPHSNGYSTLECYFLSKKASVIPRWVTDPIITGSILSLMEALRNELTEV